MSALELSSINRAEVVHVRFTKAQHDQLKLIASSQTPTAKVATLCHQYVMHCITVINGVNHDQQ